MGSRRWESPREGLKSTKNSVSADVAKLKGQAITLTYLIGGKGHEQTLTLP